MRQDTASRVGARRKFLGTASAGVMLVAAVKAAGEPVQLVVAQGYNHFEIYETLASPYGLLGRAALEQMNLAQS